MARFTQHQSLFAFTCLLMIGLTHGNPLHTVPQPGLPGAPGPNPRPLKTCVALETWVTGRIEPADCYQALDLFRLAEGAKRGSQKFEFYGPGAKPARGLLTLATPRKYTAKTCTIMVGMLAWFPPDSLPPHVTRQYFARTDVETLDRLQQAAREVVEDCVQWSKNKPLAGWQPMGELRKDMGVFVWKTDSYLDLIFRPLNGLVVPPSANSTSTA